MEYQFSLFDSTLKLSSEPIKLGALFEAYEDCRRNKRTTKSALAFEVDYEANLVKLCNEINDRTYNPGRSVAFIVNKPVKREVFAADFKDRIVHHLVIKKLQPLFEKAFIYDSYACRLGKGTSFGIKRLDKFIRKCSQNYTKDCYILKLDIQGFFMHIDKAILFDQLSRFIESYYVHADKELLLDLCRKIIDNDPAENCIFKGHYGDWGDLPCDKSLFFSAENCGLPIGNLTSQVFANLYMNKFDHYMKSELGLKYYGRYVDDFFVVHESKEHLKELVSKIRKFLEDNLKLTLHPKKIYLQQAVKGVLFLGAFLKPHRIDLFRNS